MRIHRYWSSHVVSEEDRPALGSHAHPHTPAVLRELPSLVGVAFVLELLDARVHRCEIINARGRGVRGFGGERERRRGVETRRGRKDTRRREGKGVR
jgi:hypothetical protein